MNLLEWPIEQLKQDKRIHNVTENRTRTRIDIQCTKDQRDIDHNSTNEATPYSHSNTEQTARRRELVDVIELQCQRHAIDEMSGSKNTGMRAMQEQTGDSVQ